MQDTTTAATPKTLAGLAELHAAHKAAMKSAGKDAVMVSLGDLFERFPRLQAIRWTQYTPYFNDGEPCVFGIHEPCAKVEGLSEEDSEDGYGYYAEYGLRDREPEIGKALAAFYRQAEAIEEVFQAIFDDHCRVTVTRAGAEVESYDHD